MSFEQNGYREVNDGHQGTPGGNGQGNYQQRSTYGGNGGQRYGAGGGGNGNYSGGNGNRGGGSWSGSRPAGAGGGGGFNRKPEGPPHIYKPYVIFGSDKTPQDVLDKFARIGKMLEERGYTLRIGGLKGAEVFMEDHVRRTEVLLPWKGFDNRQSPTSWTPENAKAIAEQFEPGWGQLKPVIQTFLAKNVQKVLGHKLDSPALFVVMWSEDGVEHYRDRQQRSGSAGHLAAIASNCRIPVFNFGNTNAEQRMMTYLDDLKDVTIMREGGAQRQPQQNHTPAAVSPSGAITNSQPAAAAAAEEEFGDIGF